MFDVWGILLVALLAVVVILVAAAAVLWLAAWRFPRFRAWILRWQVWLGLRDASR